MKIALSVWKDYISTVFDTADQLLVLEIDGTDSQKQSMVKLNALIMLEQPTKKALR